MSDEVIKTDIHGNPVDAGVTSGGEIRNKAVNDDGSAEVELKTEGADVGVNNPIPTDGDSVYVKDIWVSESTLVNFSGAITDLFDNLHSQIINSTSDNPKTLFIHFDRTVVSNVIGLGSAIAGNFSNVKIEIINSGGVATTVIDESASNTKYTSRTFQLPVTVGFNALRITFHTADTVSLSNCVILKTIGVVARLQAKKPDSTVTDINATAGGNLKMSLEELESGISVNSNSQLKTTQYDADGNETTRPFDESNYLSTFLLDSAAVDMAVDGSTPVEYSYTVPAGKKVKFTRGFITIEDGVSAFLPGNFGALSALTNGLQVSITPDGGSEVVLELWKTNREIRNSMFDFDQQFKSDGAYVGRWTFSKDLHNGGFSLNAGDKFSIIVQDNLTGLDHLSFRVKGNIESV